MALNYTITHNGYSWSSSSPLDSIGLSNGNVTSSISSAGTRTLNCASKYVPNNIVIGAKTLSCAGKIMAGNVVITATNAYKRVGGKIFYDNGSNGNTYVFYDSSGNVITNWTVGSDTGLNQAYYYEVSGSSTTDRWYVYDTAGYTKEYWGYYGITTGVTTNSIGSGKTNTQTILNMGAPSDTIWSFIKDKRDTNYNDCNDWFIASNAEQDKLRSSGLESDWYKYYDFWSSVEYTSEKAYVWLND